MVVGSTILFCDMSCMISPVIAMAAPVSIKAIGSGNPGDEEHVPAVFLPPDIINAGKQRDDAQDHDDREWRG